MKANIRHLACALALAIAGLAGFAQETPPASQGKVAILANDRILQGDIALVGKQYRIRRSIGESWLPAEQVRCLCGSLEEAFTYLRGQANLNDGDERLRLARWCHLHGLKQQAVDEAAAAVQLRPEHAESQRLLKGVQRSLENENAPETPAAEPEPEPTVPNLPYNAESLGLWVNKVQPILMNACARCHACGKGGAFKLMRVYDENGLGNRRLTHQNLMATLAQLDRDRPHNSPLLTYALTLHGNADRPPLPGRTAAAFRTLEEWTQQALVGLPRSTAAAPPTAAPIAPSTAAISAPPVASSAAQAPTTGASWITKWQPPAKKEVEPTTEAPKAAPVVEASEPAPVSKPAVATPAVSEFAQPRSKPEAEAATPGDPFDPSIFNRQMHPGR
ncbi:MAG: hypothetical protein JNM56_14085 [Planctomycetia bacterium]|nr:hypothetical protein [Planctomycetia bacterium]